MYHTFSRVVLLLLCVSLLSAPTVSAAEPPPAPPTEMETVTVTGKAEDVLTGSNTLDREGLERLPGRNGSINEALGILPGVQLPELGRTSIDAGEILPPKLSISGGKTYLNNFLVDGISNNNLLDPEQDDPSSITLVPGHPQSLFLDTDLIERITVYRYNIPARFGGFSGGVVDAKTREPGAEFGGEVTYRTTRHEWTQFHVDPAVAEDFENSNSQKYQPEFEKHDAGVLLNIPLAEHLRLLTSYQINYSKIPISHLFSEKVLTRRNENFFAKLAYDISSQTKLTASLNHAPYEGTYVYPNALGSEFTITGGGDQATLEVEHTGSWGNLTLTGAWKSSENRRDAPPTDFYTWAATEDKPWGGVIGTSTAVYLTPSAIKTVKKPGSYEGSLGSLESSQDGFQLSADLIAETFPVLDMTHQFNAGVSIEQITGEMKREEPFLSYTFPVLVSGSFVCPPGSTACIDGQQFLSYRQYYAPDKVRATMNLIDGYIEDTVNWKRFNLRPGVHISYDDFTENTDIAPRLSASYDLFGDQQTLLIGGINRYYGRVLLTYKIREASIPAENSLRNKTTLAWKTPTKGIPYHYSNLETPFADEMVLGVDQGLFGGRLKIVGLKREGRNEFLREKINGQYVLTNLGESHHQSISADWERSWENHYLAFNITWQEAETNNESYGAADFNDLEEIVWYDGNYISVDELPRLNYNRNWTGNLTYATKLPLGLSFTNVCRYRSGYETRVLLKTDQKTAKGIPSTVKAYRNETFPEAWVFDWRFDWDMFRDKQFIVTLEIDNVFDAKAELGDPGVTGSASSPTYIQNYDLGRQFWLGLTYKF